MTPADMECHELKDGRTAIIAVCGGNYVVFLRLDKPSNKLSLIPERHIIQFKDKPEEEKDELTVISKGYLFNKQEKGNPYEEIFATAGKNGYVYLFSITQCNDENPEKSSHEFTHFRAHLNSITDLCFAPIANHPEFANLLMTCSNDGSIMIYDILHKYCVACLKPIKMPIDDVLAIDWQEPGN